MHSGQHAFRKRSLTETGFEDDYLPPISKIFREGELPSNSRRSDRGSPRGQTLNIHTPTSNDRPKSTRGATCPTNFSLYFQQQTDPRGAGSRSPLVQSPSISRRRSDSALQPTIPAKVPDLTLPALSLITAKTLAPSHTPNSYASASASSHSQNPNHFETPSFFTPSLSHNPVSNSPQPHPRHVAIHNSHESGHGGRDRMPSAGNSSLMPPPTGRPSRTPTPQQQQQQQHAQHHHQSIANNHQSQYQTPNGPQYVTTPYQNWPDRAPPPPTANRGKNMPLPPAVQQQHGNSPNAVVKEMHRGVPSLSLDTSRHSQTPSYPHSHSHGHGVETRHGHGHGHGGMQQLQQQRDVGHGHGHGHAHHAHGSHRHAHTNHVEHSHLPPTSNINNSSRDWPPPQPPTSSHGHNNHHHSQPRDHYHREFHSSSSSYNSSSSSSSRHPHPPSSRRDDHPSQVSDWVPPRPQSRQENNNHHNNNSNNSSSSYQHSRERPSLQDQNPFSRQSTSPGGDGSPVGMVPPSNPFSITKGMYHGSGQWGTGRAVVTGSF